jgi:hypothetical protein
MSQVLPAGSLSASSSRGAHVVRRRLRPGWPWGRATEWRTTRAARALSVYRSPSMERVHRDRSCQRTDTLVTRASSANPLARPAKRASDQRRQRLYRLAAHVTHRVAPLDFHDVPLRLAGLVGRARGARMPVTFMRSSDGERAQELQEDEANVWHDILARCAASVGARVRNCISRVKSA